MKIKILTLSFLLLTTLVGCSENPTKEPFQGNQKNNIKTSEVAVADVKQLVNDLSLRKLEGKSGSIFSEELVVEDTNGETLAYALPKDEFFVSIAPYIKETHPCTNHSLTGCQGELSNKEFEVFIEDTDGNVIMDEVLTSYPNGFIDLWLPRNKNYQVTIKHGDKSVTSDLSTFKRDGTCITNMQLT